MRQLVVFLLLINVLAGNEILGLETGKIPQIIFLHGPANSGKTTLAKALQNRSELPFLYLSLDQMIEMMPEKINQWIDDPDLAGFGSRLRTDTDGSPISELLIGPFAAKVRTSFIDICATLVENGHFLIIDDVFFEAQDLERWEKGLQNKNVLWVGLTSPLYVLEEREKTRSTPKGCARYQYLHTFRRDVYDIVIDTSSISLEESVGIIFNFFKSY